MYGPSGKTWMTQAACGLLLLLAAGAVDAREPAPASQLHLQITRDGKFEVLASRAKSGDTTAAIVLLGVVGLGIATASKHASDTRREKEVVPEADTTTCRHGFEQALHDQLGQNGFAIQAVPDGKLPVLEVAIVACGFRPLNRTSGEMSAFFESKYRFTQPGAKRSKAPQRQFEIGKHRAGWSDFEHSPTLAADELRQVLTRAGRRLANNIAYAGEN